jgi:hypothetical protein
MKKRDAPVRASSAALPHQNDSVARINGERASRESEGVPRERRLAVASNDTVTTAQSRADGRRSEASTKRDPPRNDSTRGSASPSIGSTGDDDALTPASVPPGASADSLAVELAILERARKALVGHDPRTVLSELDHYDASSHSGILDSEASLLRIEALVQLSQRARAVELAERFLASHPDSPHAPRLHAIISAEHP